MREFWFSDTTVLFIVVAIVVGSLWLERHNKVARKLGAAALVILIGLLLSNVGVLPGKSPVYDFFTHHGVLAGVVLVLLSVNLGSLKQAGGPMLKAFLIGAAGTVLGSSIMGLLLFESIGEETYKLSGQYAATYIGGGMNFAAIGRELGTSSDLFTAGVAADVIVTAFWLIACIVVPEFVGRRKGAEQGAEEGAKSVDGGSDAGASSLAKRLFDSGKPMKLADIALVVAIVVGVMWVAELMTVLVPAVPMIIWLTTAALGLAQFRAISHIPGSSVFGNYLILAFLACNGAASVIARIVEMGPSIFYFAAGTVLIHGVVIFGVGSLLRIEAKMLAIASQANIGGATSAMALASARGLPHLILSGVAAGMLGNALGNYLGLLVASVVQNVVT